MAKSRYNRLKYFVKTVDENATLYVFRYLGSKPVKLFNVKTYGSSSVSKLGIQLLLFFGITCGIQRNLSKNMMEGETAPFTNKDIIMKFQTVIF